MTAHDRALELAAAAIDFPLTAAERRELDEHVASCPSCRRAVAELRADATAVLTPVTPLSGERSQAVLSAALRRRRRGGPPVRMLAVAALFALGTGAALAVGAQLADDGPTETPPVVVRPSESPSPTATADPSTSPPPRPSAEPSGAPTEAPSAPPSQPTAEPTPGTSQPPVVAGPIRVDARSVGTGMEIAPAPDGGAFVTVPADGETALFRLEPDGAIASGWPVYLPDTACAPPLAVEDGSVRLLCLGQGNDQGLAEVVRAHALDASGRVITGWPVDAPCCVETEYQEALDAQMDGTRLSYVAARQVAPVYQLVSIDAGGQVQVGAEIPHLDGHVATVLGPDQVGYAVRVAGPATMEAVAFDATGVVDGWPVQLGDWSSPPAFLPDGGIAFATTADGASRLVVLAADGSESGIVALPFELRIPWSGAGDLLYAPMLVAPDGTLRIVGGSNEVWAVDPDADVLGGWPWIAASAFQQSGYCAPDETGCGRLDVERALGPEGQLVVAVEATDTGGALFVINADGTVREGWPVTLNRQGSEFWELVTAPSGVTYAVAVEREGDAGFSGTVLRLEPDSTVSWATTLIEP